MSVEDKVKKTYREELIHIGKIMGPAFVVGTIGTYVGGEIAQRLTDVSSFWDINTIPYAGGFVAGLGFFFGQEFITNRDKYPKLNSKEFRSFCLDFYLYDIVADMTLYSPTFAATNTYLTTQQNLDLATSSAIANVVGGVVYMAGSAKAYPWTQKMSRKLRKSAHNVEEYVKNRTPSKLQYYGWVVKDILGESINAYVDPLSKPIEYSLDKIRDLSVRKTA